MFRSIRGTLLAWYGAILFLVVAGFGAAIYLKMQHSLREEVNAKLQARAQAVAAAVVAPADGPLRVQPTDEVKRYFKKYYNARGEADDEGVDPYFVVWDGAGEVAAQSNPQLEVPRPEAPPPKRGLRSPRGRDRDAYREVFVAGPGDSIVLVGQDTRRFAARARNFLGVLLLAGAGALALALLGGWFLTARALAPIARMSAAAADISATNLSRRIDAARTQDELGRLAHVLNATFDRLEAAFQRQVRFTADASHEFRTPLSVVIAHAELALKRERSGEEYREALATCLRAARRMQVVTDGLLVLARADACELDIAREPVDLRKVVEEAAGLLAPLATERHVAVHLDLASATILGDRDRLQQIADNVLSNALHHNREHGRVDVSLRRDGSWVLLAIADTGCGIPAKDRPFVFERFYRVDKARARDRGGVGLGLAITKWLVESHGGHISFVSDEGAGTTFTIRLPLPWESAEAMEPFVTDAET
jgi:heavy metal sensor kinase